MPNPAATGTRQWYPVRKSTLKKNYLPKRDGLSFLVIPLQEAEAVPTSWYNILYYTFVVASALLGSLFTTLVLMLYSSVNGLIDVIEPTEEQGALVASDGE